MSERIYFDAILEPNKPLGLRGLAMLIGFVALVSFCVGILFVLRGAWPVTPFFGADLLLLAWAMRASVRSSRRREHLVLTDEKLLIERHGARGDVRREEINPYWLRVDHEGCQASGECCEYRDSCFHGCENALNCASNQGFVLGAQERANVATALRRALCEARNFTTGV